MVLIVVALSVAVWAGVYKWVDEKGTVHFTDDYSNIPSSYRDRLKAEIGKDIQEEETSLEPRIPDYNLSF